jgi:hypothetical protein
MNGGCLAFSHRQRQSLSYIIIDSSSFPSFLSLSLPDTSKMAQNGRTPSILLSQTHFLYAFLFLWYPFTIFFFLSFFQFFGFQIRSQTSSPLLSMQRRRLARFVNSKSPFFSGSFLVSIFIFLVIYSIETRKCLIFQVIRNGFYQTKHVEHKGVVCFSF